jgi:8-oxo-dGTP diphosphatase
MKQEFSAGGIVYKKTRNNIYILVCQHSQHHGWVFPKGLIGDHIENENKEETAVREVKEETGVNAKIIMPLKEVSYWYVFNKEKIKKTVYYFIMKYVSGNIENHDFEMENVEWVEKNKVKDKLTYKSDKKVWEEAEKFIK